MFGLVWQILEYELLARWCFFFSPSDRSRNFEFFLEILQAFSSCLLEKKKKIVWSVFIYSYDQETSALSLFNSRDVFSVVSRLCYKHVELVSFENYLYYEWLKEWIFKLADNALVIVDDIWSLQSALYWCESIIPYWKELVIWYIRRNSTLISWS